MLPEPPPNEIHLVAVLFLNNIVLLHSLINAPGISSILPLLAAVVSEKQVVFICNKESTDNLPLVSNPVVGLPLVALIGYCAFAKKDNEIRNKNNNIFLMLYWY